MILNEKQLAEIKFFISKKGVRYLDVQMEIIDHVASCVEEKMNENSDLSFETALKETHASFGIFGFGGVEDGITNGLSKKYNRIFWRQFLALFGVKYVGVFLLLGFLLYKIQIFVNDYNNLMSIVIPSLISIVGLVIVFRLNFKKYKNFLVYRISASYLAFLGSFLLCLNLIVSKSSNATFLGVNGTYLLASIVVVLFVAYIITAFKTILKGIKESEMLIDKYKLLRH